MRFLFLTLLIFLMGCSSKGDIGSGTEIGNGYVTAFLYDSTGTPIAQSAIRVLTTEEIPKIIDTVYTSSIGLFTFSTPLYDSVTLLIEGEELSLLQPNYRLSRDETLRDTFYVENTGTLKVVVGDSSSLFQTEYYIAGTDLFFSPNQLIKEDSFWVVEQKLPAMEKSRILYKKDDTIRQFSTTFTIVSDSTTTILGGLLIDSLPLKSQEQINLTGDSNTLWYHSGLEIYKVENLAITDSITASAQFDFSDLTTVATGSDDTFWFGTVTGHTGYITPSGYKAIIPNPVCNTAIQSLASFENNNWIAPKDKGLILKGSFDSTYLFDSVQFKRLLPGKNETLWAATATGKVYLINSDHSATITTLKGDEESDIIVDIALDTTGDLLLLTNSDLQRISKDGNIESIENHGLDISSIIHIESNAKGLWLCSSDTLYLLQKNKLFSISWKGSPLEKQRMSETYSQLKGQFWLATESALFRCTNLF